MIQTLKIVKIQMEEQVLNMLYIQKEISRNVLIFQIACKII